jgi:predicted GIY-YIG superfamily endonuclease
MNGWIYTIHLHTRLGRAGRNGALHYTGWASDTGLLARLRQHRDGQGARMMAWCAGRGVTWHVGHLTRGTRADERRLKQHGAARRCWTCITARKYLP